MKKELTSFEIAYRIVREVCGGKGYQKKKRTKSLAEMVETDIDIFAGDDHVQVKKGTREDCNHE